MIQHKKLRISNQSYIVTRESIPILPTELILIVKFHIWFQLSI